MHLQMPDPVPRPGPVPIEDPPPNDEPVEIPPPGKEPSDEPIPVKLVALGKPSRTVRIGVGNGLMLLVKPNGAHVLGHPNFVTASFIPASAFARSS